MTAAESFAKEVVYIPVSSLGGQVELDLHSGLPGIRPKSIRPHWVVVPVLYAISRVLPALIPRLIRRRERSGIGSGQSVEAQRHRSLVEPFAVARKALTGGGPMSQELHYTSAPRGLKPGSRGFCTVASTVGLSGPLAERLESLSGYQPIYPVHDPAAARNPVNFMHIKPAWLESR